MVGMVSRSPREKVSNLMDSTKFGIEIPSKLQNLNKLNKDWFRNDPVLISEFLPNLFDLQSDRFSPVRKLVTQIIGEIGLRHVEIIPEIVPVLLSTIVQKDETPAVARQAITCGIHLFRFTLEKVALQGLYSSELDESVETSWASMLKFKEKMYAIAFQAGGSDSIRLPAIKFVEAVILLYTPDPNSTSEPPPPLAFEGSSRVEFNISWLRGGHPLLKVGDLSVEASQSLGVLLDHLRFPAVKSLSRSIIILLVNSFAAIAKKRPGFYGRILPVLLALDPSNSTSNGVHVYATRYCLKKAFLSCLECTHPSAMPWRERLLGALKELKSGGVEEQAISKSNGGLGERIDDPMLKDSDSEYLQEEKPSINSLVAVQNIVGKKRLIVPDISDAGEDGDASGKRIRASPDRSSTESKKDPAFVWDDNSSIKLQKNIDSEPVQQLVAMFGALVAQGEKAVGSLEILIASISADLLTEVVMATMRNLPSNLPKAEGAEDLLQDGGVLGGSTQVKHSLTLLADVFSRSGAFPQIASSLCAQQSVSSVMEKSQDKECLVASISESDHETETASLLTQSQVSSDSQSEMEKSAPAFTSDLQDVGSMESEIPGLESVPRLYVKQETLVPSSLAPPDSEDAIQEYATSLGGRSPVNLLPTMSTDRSEEVSSKSAVADANNTTFSTATSVVFNQLVLPKMTAPVVSLSDEQKDNLQLIAFTRIVEAYKQIAVAGGSHIRVSLLAYLGVQFPLELGPWKILQKHILSDYTTHEGQEFTLRVLYRLFGEAEEHDFFSSTAAKSVYDMFLLTVAETLRDSFPASDKSLSKLLGEVPYLPKSVFILLEHLCCPGNSAKDEKELQSGDRVTQGLSAIWNLILLRPPIREACLNIALQSAVHHLEEVRMKAIRLVANKLYPISSIALRIEDFAKEVLLSVINGVLTADKTEVDGTSIESEKESNLEKPSNEHPSVGAIFNDPSDTDNSSMSECISPISEAQRCMSLYFALCTKKHSLFRQIFILYKSTSKAVKQAIHRHIPILVRTMGSSMELLDIISDPPPGSEDLLMQVLNTLTDGIIPSPELIFAIRKSYDSKLKNAEILIPILPFLPRDEVLMIFPHLVTLSLDKFQAALIRVLQCSSPSGQILTPAEVLIAIHGIDPDRDGIPLKKVTDACNACFEQRQTFTHQVLAKVLNQLVEQIPLPLLFMRTVLQAIGAFPALVGFIMEILSRLVSKQIWKYPKQWVGFLKCAQLTKPQSFSVLLQLPPVQLENALNRIAALKAPLIAHANQPSIRSTLPRSVLVVLGIGTDSHQQPKTTSQQQQQQQEEAQQTSEAQTEEDTTTTTVISDKEGATGEITKESSSSAS